MGRGFSWLPNASPKKMRRQKERNALSRIIFFSWRSTSQIFFAQEFSNPSDCRKDTWTFSAYLVELAYDQARISPSTLVGTAYSPRKTGRRRIYAHYRQERGVRDGKEQGSMPGCTSRELQPRGICICLRNPPALTRTSPSTQLRT